MLSKNRSVHKTKEHQLQHLVGEHPLNLNSKMVIHILKISSANNGVNKFSERCIGQIFFQMVSLPATSAGLGPQALLAHEGLRGENAIRFLNQELG